MALDTFGKRLRALRQDRDISQIELREKLEKEHQVTIGQTYISELERTAKMPSLEVAAAMARALNISLDYLGLLTEDSEASYKHEPPIQYITPEADEAGQLIDKMSLEQRLLVLNLARNLSNAPIEARHRLSEVTDLLNSIERQLGKSARIEVEKIMRNKGMFIDNAS